MIRRIIRKPWFLGLFVIIFAIGIAWNIPLEKRKYGLLQGGMMTDYTGLLPERIDRIEHIRDRDELQRIIKEANPNGSHISIAGLQHSQGGHTYYKDGIVLECHLISFLEYLVLFCFATVSSLWHTAVKTQKFPLINTEKNNNQHIL